MRRQTLLSIILLLLAAVLPLLAVPAGVPQPAAPVARQAEATQVEARQLDQLLVSLELTPPCQKLDGASCEPGEVPVAYLTALEQGLQQMARYVYDSTKGQVVLRKIVIVTSGVPWRKADIRIIAGRLLLIGGSATSAEMGGYSGERVSSASSSTPALLGRLWDNQGIRPGVWSDNAWRRLAQEWVYSTLHLHKEYTELLAQLNMDEVRYCHTCFVPPKIVTYYYTPSMMAVGQGNNRRVLLFFRTSKELLNIDPQGCLATSREPRSSPAHSDGLLPRGGAMFAVAAQTAAVMPNVTRVAYRPERSGSTLALARELPAGREPADRRRLANQAYRHVALV